VVLIGALVESVKEGEPLPILNCEVRSLPPLAASQIFVLEATTIGPVVAGVTVKVTGVEPQKLILLIIGKAGTSKTLAVTAKRLGLTQPVPWLKASI
jgi:hypothetical protein